MAIVKQTTYEGNKHNLGTLERSAISGMADSAIKAMNTVVLSGGGTEDVASLNVHVSVSMNVNSNSTTVSSGNTSYTVDAGNPGQFIVGEAVMANTAADVNANNSGIYGVIDSVTYLDGDSAANTATVSIAAAASANFNHYLSIFLT